MRSCAEELRAAEHGAAPDDRVSPSPDDAFTIPIAAAGRVLLTEGTRQPATRVPTSAAGEGGGARFPGTPRAPPSQGLVCRWRSSSSRSKRARARRGTTAVTLAPARAAFATPRTQPSCPGRPDDCMARMMRKSNLPRSTSDVASSGPARGGAGPDDSNRGQALIRSDMGEQTNAIARAGGPLRIRARRRERECGSPRCR